jgi:hypothetical protein
MVQYHCTKNINECPKWSEHDGYNNRPRGFSEDSAEWLDSGIKLKIALNNVNVPKYKKD